MSLTVISHISHTFVYIRKQYISIRRCKMTIRWMMVDLLFTLSPHKINVMRTISQHYVQGTSVYLDDVVLSVMLYLVWLKWLGVMMAIICSDPALPHSLIPSLFSPSHLFLFWSLSPCFLISLHFSFFCSLSLHLKETACVFVIWMFDVVVMTAESVGFWKETLLFTRLIFSPSHIICQSHPGWVTCESYRS